MKKRLKKTITPFNIFLFLIMAFWLIVCIYPLWYVVVASFSNPAIVSGGKPMFWIEGFNLTSYIKTLERPYLLSSYANTIFYSVFGTMISLFLTVLGAYPLSKKRLHGRHIFLFIISFTMWFHAGMMPTYLNFRNLGLLDSRWAILLQGAVSTFNVIIMRTAFEGVPDAIEESMKMDGANDLQVLIHAYIPLTIPTFMTLTLYYFVGRWNSYFWPMLLVKEETKAPLQVILRGLIVEMTAVFENADNVDIVTNMSKETVVYSTIVIATIPMLILFPFIQKYFVKGVTVGAVKG